MECIYLDNAATTKVRDEVIKEMIPYFGENYGNPSSIYEVGRKSKKAIDDARKVIANAFSATDGEIFFTSCGSESDNFAIRGVCDALKSKGNHIITTTVEHHAVLTTCEKLEKSGFEVTYLPVDKDGLINLEELKNAIKPTTILITIMFVNNEIGTIMPIKQIGQIAKENKIYFHTDAVQAAGHIDINVNDLNIDLMSVSAHKFNGPKGVGFLYVRKGVKINPIIYGGSQENNKRAGTENVAQIVGLAKALELSLNELKEEEVRIRKLRDRLVKGVLDNIPFTNINGTMEHRIFNNINFSFDFIEGESLLLLLDMNNIAASSGSACTSGSLDPSHVLLGLGLLHEKAHGSLRLSLGKYTTDADIDKILEVLPSIVTRLREMSPLYEDYLKTKK